MNQRETEVLVIGSGIAGLFYAIHCARFAHVTIVTKGNIGESNTMYAQGGISAVFDKNDCIENHVQDTLKAGDGLCNESAVRLVVQNAKHAVLELDKLQVKFDKNKNNVYDLHREGGHSHARVVHATDATGKEVENTLVSRVRSSKNITIIENCFAVDLCVTENICTGIIAIENNSKESLHIHAEAVMLASGGAGQVYELNTNPSIATGDGFAMAKRAGALINNMEFVQFHPTAFYNPGQPVFLITEAIRGFGGELKNSRGASFMEKYHPLKSLAPRDVVARAIISELKSSGNACVHLDVRKFSAKELQKHFPNIYDHCQQAGLDLSKDMIPVVPAAHYMCGGVVTDLNGRTTIKNLYACGEVSYTGVHGANRLASNSLLEGLVFAEKAAVDTELLLQCHVPLLKPIPVVRLNKRDDVIHSNMKKYLQHLMWIYTGINRNETELNYCEHELNGMHQQISSKIAKHGVSVQAVELKNMIETSLLIVNAALHREENRGCHFRTDIPAKLDYTQNISHSRKTAFNFD
ncbi:MAG: L-aspartate oxidase [Chitinophagales bacterium]